MKMVERAVLAALPPLPPPLPPQKLPSPAAFSPLRSPPTLDDLLDAEGGFFGIGSLNVVRNNLWDDAKFETDYNKPLTSLTDKTENTIEIVPKVKEKTKPEEITLSDELSKLFLKPTKKIAEQEEKINDLPLNNLEEIFSKIDKGEIPKELKFFVGGLNNEFENRISSNDFLDFLQSQCWNLMHARFPGATEIHVGQVKSRTSMPDWVTQLIYYISPCFM